MDLIKFLTPKNTEEVRPGFFIQKKKKGYKRIYPACWNGKIIWRNFILGGNFWKYLGITLFILYLSWAYKTDVKMYQDFYIMVKQNLSYICSNMESYQENTLLNITEIIQ